MWGNVSVWKRFCLCTWEVRTYYTHAHHAVIPQGHANWKFPHVSVFMKEKKYYANIRIDRQEVNTAKCQLTISWALAHGKLHSFTVWRYLNWKNSFLYSDLLEARFFRRTKIECMKNFLTLVRERHLSFNNISQGCYYIIALIQFGRNIHI